MFWDTLPSTATEAWTFTFIYLVGTQVRKAGSASVLGEGEVKALAQEPRGDMITLLVTGLEPMT